MAGRGKVIRHGTGGGGKNRGWEPAVKLDVAPGSGGKREMQEWFSKTDRGREMVTDRGSLKKAPANY